MKIPFQYDFSNDYLFYRKDNHLPIAVLTLSVVALALTATPLAPYLGLTIGWVSEFFRAIVFVFMFYCLGAIIAHGFAAIWPMLNDEPRIFNSTYENINKSKLGMNSLGLAYAVLLFMAGYGISGTLVIITHLLVGWCLRHIKYCMNKDAIEKLAR